ncbi:class I SAM-dependent methyltransferase [Methylocella silvestris]|uniref:class I SAM-dependent methyltransferase n=1 Tax=Methylocella silvestris TaxID=199596 RepID=UPI0015E0911D|nr:class I SAM-dependent methyltransferase [Methylocella silvestris]
MQPRLADLFFEKNSKTVDKWEQYLGVYERELKRFLRQEKPLDLLEIGVQNGGSLELWSQYLPSGSKITGIDIDTAVGALRFETENIEVHILDATDAAKLEDAFQGRGFDIIIDDGSHRSKDVVATFKALFHHLNPGGVFFIEDLHCSYYASHEGGLRRPGSSIEWLKTAIDALNLDHIASHEILDEERGLFVDLNRSLGSITFYDSIAVVERLVQEKSRPYRRLYSGKEAVVEPEQNWLTTSSKSALQSILLGHAAAQEISASLLEIIEEQRGRISALQNECGIAKAKIDDLANTKIDDLEGNLSGITKSRSC